MPDQRQGVWHGSDAQVMGESGPQPLEGRERRDTVSLEVVKADEVTAGLLGLGLLLDPLLGEGERG